MKNSTKNQCLAFNKSALVELNADTLKSVDSGVYPPTTLVTILTVIIDIF